MIDYRVIEPFVQSLIITLKVKHQPNSCTENQIPAWEVRVTGLADKTLNESIRIVGVETDLSR